MPKQIDWKAVLLWVGYFVGVSLIGAYGLLTRIS